jgi:hypothetical protein
LSFPSHQWALLCGDDDSLAFFGTSTMVILFFWVILIDSLIEVGIFFAP